MIKNPDLKKAIDGIMMLGVDCGSFLKFTTMLNALDREVKDAGKSALTAAALLDLVYRFSRLVDISQGK